MPSKRLKYRRFKSGNSGEERVMRVYCPVCEGRAVIKKTVRKHKELSDLYCSCNDVECGHTFVLNVTFSHTISHSAKVTGNMMLHAIINSFTPEQKQMTLDILKSSAAN
ncbi:transcriptional regulator [Salmonella enterica subsp. enterica serovar Kambole]|nr:transcriptional regulator [Salmonella enterica subsp. enterica serovar Abony]EBY6400446.1 transcriptional regulator [Salmonella enterica subsp. enterica serovar Abony]ECF0925739.1 transcriptional regulator [Salmonella enterica subsp. enterica serovar Coeln]ECG4917588.1 transcriptional regulator [Salmonella enterica subsp. enterica serovar Kambole]